MIYTFYSYKGGVGRSMALANVAELLYKKDRKVLIVDWDLEAPGLERFFYEDTTKILGHYGLIDLLLDYKENVSNDSDNQNPLESQRIKLTESLIDIYHNGRFQLLTAGKRSESSFRDYAHSILSFDWEDFYTNWEGERYFEWLRKQFESMADIVLIDSRTGVTEISGVCTYQLADMVIMFCAPNQQNLNGTYQMALNFTSPQLKRIRPKRPLDILIIPARVEDRAEQTYLNKFEKQFTETFDSKFLSGISLRSLRSFWDLKIPYVPYYSFSETIAVRDENEHSEDVVRSFKKISDIITEKVSQRTIKKLEIKKGSPLSKISKINPTIVIGLGGTGVKAVTYFKKKLLEYNQEIPQFVRFLAIDIDELKGEVPSACLFGGNIRLDPEKNEFFRITDQTRGSEAKNIPEVSSWFPEEAYRYLPLNEGARQAKPIGRLGFFLAHEEITQWVHRLSDRLVTPEIKSMLPMIKSGELNVYLVSSICGGTGAGLFLDIAYEFRYWQMEAQLPQKARIKGLFATGDVYDVVSKRVLANTYASLRELNWAQREHASFHPVYPDGARNVIHSRAFDAIYLFGDSNKSDIEFDSPDDFAQLCAEFIFLDSGADVQEGGDPLSAMMQSTRNNAEVYTMNCDADGTPHCYSAMGLCKIRFPGDRVAELCAAQMSQSIIDYHIIGKLDQNDVLEARRKSKEFIINEGLSCTDDNSDLPDRLVEKQLEGGERIPLDNWITQSLAKAYNHDAANIKKLEISRITNIVQFLNKELNQFQEDMSDRGIEELQHFQRIVDKVIQSIFKENLGVNFVVKFLEETLKSAKESEDYAQQEMKYLLGHEERLADQMNNQIREMAGMLEGGMFKFLQTKARLAQLKDTYKAIRQHFINKINVMKMRAAVNFYNGVHDAKQKLMDGGEGAISRLSKMRQDITLIQSFVADLSKTFEDAYENNKRIQGSPFEILIYDNDQYSTLHEIYDEIYNDSLRAKLFGDILERIGGSIWNVRDYMNDDTNTYRLRNIFMEISTPLFQEQINKKSVAQRIREARNNLTNPIDYTPRIQGAYDVSNYFCRLNDATGRFAGLRDSEQSIVCVVGYKDEDDTAWNELERMLREAIGKAGRQIPFTHTSDKHSILLYREFSGFPAYTLRRIGTYHQNYVSEARRENTPPLQMLTNEGLEHINVPTSQVLSKFEVMVVEALSLGVITNDEENYYMVTTDEWRRRKLAEDLQKQGKDADINDRTAGSNRKLGSKFTEVISRMNSNLPEEARLSSNEVKWMDLILQQIQQRKEALKEHRNILCDLYEAMYFEGLSGTATETINLASEIRPSIVFILKRDFALKEDHIFRPEQRHAELLHRVYIGTEKEPAIISGC